MTPASTVLAPSPEVKDAAAAAEQQQQSSSAAAAAESAQPSVCDRSYGSTDALSAAAHDTSQHYFGAFT
jgi:hypothetical protein